MRPAVAPQTTRRGALAALGLLAAPPTAAAKARAGLVETPVEEAGLVGRFHSVAGAHRRPGVIMLNGSDGGTPSAAFAGDLARAGVPTLALAYMPDARGLPKGLPATGPIPLETVFRALEWMRRRPEVDPGRVALMGVSRGAELALLIASLRPDVAGVVAFSPGRHVWGSPADRMRGVKFDTAMWSLEGRPVPFRANKPDFALGVREWFARAPEAAKDTEIAVERINGPVLLLSSTADGEWPASDYADEIVQRLRAARFAHPVINAQYPDASHLLMGFGPEITKLPVPGTTYVIDFGGSAEGTVRARDAAWANAKAFVLGLPART